MTDKEAKVCDRLARNYDKMESTIGWSVQRALVRRGRIDELYDKNERTVEELKDEVRSKVVNTLYTRYNPDAEASPATFSAKGATFAALKAVDRLMTSRKRFGVSLDAPVENKEGQIVSPFFNVPEEEETGGYRGAAKIRTETDLHLIKEMLSKTDWAIFSRRYARKISDVQLAEELGWTRDRLRYYLKGYKKRMTRLLLARR